MMKKILPLFIVLLLSYWLIKPFFIPGFFSMHDDTQVARVFEMHKSLSDGMFPVRWISDLGYNYGYPIFNFYAPLAYYVGSLFMLLGFDALIATKIMMAFGIILSGIFMYLLAKQFWGVGGGFISAVLYLYAPYHAVDIYVRGDVAEFWAYTFIPLVFYSLWQVYKNMKWKYVVIGSLSFAAIILSHNLTAMMITPFVLVFAFLLYIFSRSQKKLQKPYYLLIVLFTGILLASFYWLPVFAEMKYTNVLSQVGKGADYKDHFVCLAQLWDSPWGFGGSTNSCIDGLSYKIGKLHIILSLFSIATLFLFWKSGKEKFAIILFSVSSILLSIFLMLDVSKFVWDTISPMAFFQYPWRFLLVVTFFVSFLGGASISILKPVFLKYVACVVLLTGIIYVNMEIFAPQTIFNKSAKDYTNDYALHWTTSKISDEYMPRGFYKPKNPNEIPSNKISAFQDIKILSLAEKTQEIDLEILARDKSYFIINMAYFPSWKVFIDNKMVKFQHDTKGLLVNVPEGRHNVTLKFIQTPIEKAGNILSIAGVLVLILGIIYCRKQIYERKKT
jgi:uncharacterized membrane protein